MEGGHYAGGHVRWGGHSWIIGGFYWQMLFIFQKCSVSIGQHLEELCSRPWREEHGPIAVSSLPSESRKCKTFNISEKTFVKMISTIFSILRAWLAGQATVSWGRSAMTSACWSRPSTPTRPCTRPCVRPTLRSVSLCHAVTLSRFVTGSLHQQEAAVSARPSCPVDKCRTKWVPAKEAREYGSCAQFRSFQIFAILQTDKI